MFLSVGEGERSVWWKLIHNRNVVLQLKLIPTARVGEGWRRRANEGEFDFFGILLMRLDRRQPWQKMAKKINSRKEGWPFRLDKVHFRIRPMLQNMAQQPTTLPESQHRHPRTTSLSALKLDTNVFFCIYRAVSKVADDSL